MRLMGQRYIPDSDMFQTLVYPSVLGYQGDQSQSLPFYAGSNGAGIVRCYPRALDVMAVLGSETALTILTEDGDTDFEDYQLRFEELRSEFDQLSVLDWHYNLYYAWLYSLKALLNDLPVGYPNFMRSEAWQKHQLHSALGSWSQLRHDTILYAKQGETLVGSPVPPPPPPGYLEPQAECLTRLLELSRMTRVGLSDLQVLSTTVGMRLTKLEAMLTDALDIVAKQLTNQSLNEADYEFIKSLAGRLDVIVRGVDETELKTTLVADVHTHAVEVQVVEEATGKVDLMVVACPAPDGSVFWAAGPVLSYYEFKHSMVHRLTDESWRSLLNSDDCPDRPVWYQELMP